MLRAGELWEVSGYPGRVSRVAVGPMRDLGLDELTATDPQGVLGDEDGGLGFPLLIKLIAAHQNLSVQVHPDDYVAAIRGGRGKDEAWYVLHAEPGAWIICGLKPGVTLHRLTEELDREDITACLRRVMVKTGDFVVIPAGCVHALGAGVIVLEIQPSVDTTYRLYDWGRVPKEGEPRPLQIKEGLAAIKPLYRPEVIRGWQSAELLYCGKRFQIIGRRMRRTQWVTKDKPTCRVWSIVQGKLLVEAGPVRIALNRGSSVLFPAMLKEWLVEGTAEVLETVPGRLGQGNSPLNKG